MSFKTKVILAQLGSPRTPSVKDVRAFLREFLGDPRVVDAPRWLWAIILNLFVLPFRPKRSAKAYGRIWDGEGFPLVKTTLKVAQGLKGQVDSSIEVEAAFLLAEPRLWQALDASTADEVLILPQFPQYAESTTGSVVDVVAKQFHGQVNIPRFTVLESYHRSTCFIDNSVRLIREAIAKNPPQVLVISFHGIPLRRVLQKKDLYFQHCLETFRLIERGLGDLPFPVEMTFQSRFGSEVWLGPYTDATVERLVSEGKKKIAVYCPSFVVDCLETTDEIGHELSHQVKELGGELNVVPCLNDDATWISDYAKFINTWVLGSAADRHGLFHSIDVREELMQATAEQAKAIPQPLAPESKRVLKLMFLTLFLDLIGFSIIFPMFPALAKHYLEVDSDNVFLRAIFSVVGGLQNIGGEVAIADNASSVVLFGGILGGLYSLLQFVAAPLWGTISDRVGRKPVLVISILGLFISYGLWFCAGSFTLLIAGRALGGLMSGNLSIASAVVADVTDEKNRSKGMAFIGIAFAMGFIFGPAIGGISAHFNILERWPDLANYGVNPFSVAALVAAVLSFCNLFLVWFAFPETLPAAKRGLGTHAHRSANPLKLFRALPFKGTNQTNLAYFFFIAAFAGMEFTLTFLAVERFGYSPMDNAKMFVFIGFLIGMVQGGYVRRKAHSVGEGKMAVQGLACILPGLLLIGWAPAQWALYAGLFFLAIGSAMVIPCLTSLVSLYTPSEAQGRALGQFRGLGALGRVIGPLAASLAYWRFGGGVTYVVGAVLIVVPLFMVRALPRPTSAH